MKIVCDACQAKYSISDDKVQGKVFKIRCKKCSNIIVVRGGASVVEPAPPPQQEKDTRVYDYGYEGGDHAPAGDEAVWHVVINQDQVGPMTAVDVQHRFSSGEIDAETYIWREGFADWLPLSQVDTFTALLGSGATASASASPRGKGADAVAAMFGGGEDPGTGRSDPGDLFAAASAGSARNEDDNSDLFGSKPIAAPSSQGAKLRGERNENSVLFSLNNLAQLASDKPAPSPRPGAATSPAPGAATGSSGGEGSGLIDIRSMASAYLGSPAGGAAKPATAGIGSIDDLPVFGGGGFTEPAVIVPIASRSNNNKLLYALIGSVGLLAVAAVVVVIVLITGSKSTPPAAVPVAGVGEPKIDIKPPPVQPD
ncbi:MAG TPA: GYF domain-containing protein, partial [Kofleriaceae bacterium]|nr:GYF domain-containing protein [Kofleriaceae bacterium]